MTEEKVDKHRTIRISEELAKNPVFTLLESLLPKFNAYKNLKYPLSVHQFTEENTLIKLKLLRHTYTELIKVLPEFKSQCSGLSMICESFTYFNKKYEDDLTPVTINFYFDDIKHWINEYINDRIIVTRSTIRENIRREKLMNRFDQEEKRFQKKYGVD